jgi:3-deoxy-D-manno-octulosonic-acid transferase
LALLPVIEQTFSRFDDVAVVITTGTRTSADLLADRLPAGAVHQFVPIDRPAWVRRFLDHWQPDLAIWAESDLWPNLVMQTYDRGIPMALINARMSERSFAGWQRWGKGLVAALLSRFQLILAQTDGDRLRLQKLGAKQAITVGNLKAAAAPLPKDKTKLAALRATIGTRPVWLAASTHRGEEVIAMEVHRTLRAVFPDLLTLICPRHPNRGDDIRAELVRDGSMVVAQRSRHEDITPETDLYLADTMGEMGVFYRLAPIAFVGKSLVAPGGGQNPLEPARLRCCVVFGGLMGNFAEMAQHMLAEDVAIKVENRGELADVIAGLLHDPARMRARGKKSRRFAKTEAGILSRTMDVLSDLFSMVGCVAKQMPAIDPEDAQMDAHLDQLQADVAAELADVAQNAIEPAVPVADPASSRPQSNDHSLQSDTPQPDKTPERPA